MRRTRNIKSKLGRVSRGGWMTRRSSRGRFYQVQYGRNHILVRYRKGGRTINKRYSSKGAARRRA